MKKTFKQVIINGHQFQLLTLPGTDLFQFEIVNTMGSNIERVYDTLYTKNMYGISHFIEHLGFRVPKDYTTDELMEAIKTNGTYNASTNHDRINYWFRTISDKAEKAINLVCNYAFNDLTNIPQEEFELERKVVSNEARRYADDDQTMFYFNGVPTACGYHPEDNIIGIPETIEKFTLEQAIAVKRLFLASRANTFNVTYDNTVYSEGEVIEMVQKELQRWTMPTITPEEMNLIQYYYKLVSFPNQKDNIKVPNESEQAMTTIVMDAIDPDDKNIFTARFANAYLSKYSDTSLTDIIREKNGLTYGIHFYDDLVAYEPFVFFSCDVTKGTENLMMTLLEDSIKQSVDNFTEEVYNKLVETTELKRTLAMVNQQNYTDLFWLGLWYPNLIDRLSDEYEVDVDQTSKIIQQRYASYGEVKQYLENIRHIVVDKLYTKITN